MSELEALRAHMAAVERMKAQERQAREAEQLTRFEAEFRAAMGAYAGLLDELDAQFEWLHGKPGVTLTYRGRKRAYGSVHSDLLVSIAAWTKQEDANIALWEEEREKARSDWLRNLRGEMRLYPGGVSYAEREIKEYDLQGDAEVAEALAGYKERVQEQAAREEAKQRELEAERETARQAERARLFEIAACAETWNVLREVAERVDHEFCYMRGYGNADLSYDADLVAAYEQAAKRVQRLEEERAATRNQAELDAFREFAWYKVHYAIASGDEDLVVETDWFPSLWPFAQEDGWWRPANGAPTVWVAHLVKVEEMVVGTVDEMPTWCPMVETEWGKIRVPPGKALQA